MVYNVERFRTNCLVLLTCLLPTTLASAIAMVAAGFATSSSRGTVLDNGFCDTPGTASIQAQLSSAQKREPNRREFINLDMLQVMCQTGTYFVDDSRRNVWRIFVCLNFSGSGGVESIRVRRFYAKQGRRLGGKRYKDP